MIWIVFIGTMVLSLVAVAGVKSAYARFSRMPARSGLTGAQAAGQILNAAGIHDVNIVAADGLLGDHYDPIHKKLVLSEEIFNGRSVAALGISAHECGHAIQQKIAYAPLQWRMASVGATNFASQIVTWLPILGLFTGLLSQYTGLLIMAIGWGVIMLFNLITLPVEFDASRRAKLILSKMGMIAEGEETRAVNKMLNAAAWTYVAAFITSLIYVLWFLLPLLSGRRD
ncbi:MAG: zinc metallopeptidase [bacterium]